MEQNIRPSPARIVEVSTEEEGQRIDNFLTARLKGVPKTLIYRILRKGEVRVNKGRIRHSYRVRRGDQVRIPPLRTSPTKLVSPGAQALDRVADAVLYEDERLLVLNKPAGMAVHGGSGLSYGLIEALRAARPDLPSVELVHRLDRETSGCLLVAKRRSMLRALHELIREQDMDKRYLALLRGRWEGGERTVEAPLVKNVLASGERMVRVGEAGKPSVSVFAPRVRYRDCTLVEITLVSGRTHQARVHAAHIGHPIAGDPKYGDEAFNARMREAYGLRRLFLHAATLRFQLPNQPRPLEFRAPLDNALQQVLAALDAAEQRVEEA
ncbi:23S rRNA pseudouridine(955/2504/2580) synthase RluC [Ectothiorhodospiraceae bacterium 2226]|nr:23S rRNA pseudouridine(955/2504/2580) synthase RluC [Ectothiorhodospiraceae bacterium 2226]